MESEYSCQLLAWEELLYLRRIWIVFSFQSRQWKESYWSNDIGVYSIKDPYLGYNELSCEWVAEKSWIYKTILPDLIDHGSKEAQDGHNKPSISLVFEGLDTFAIVRLNGSVIHQNDNMFIPCRIDITNSYSCRRGKENILEIEFDPATRRAREIKDAHSQHKWVGYNGDMARLAVRKAQYHW